MRERLILEGFATKTYRSLTVIAGLLACAHIGYASDFSLTFTGNLVGSVVNAENVPQMGATVQLFDHVGRLRARTLSLADGRFGFAGLAADLYSVRVTLADYLPAVSDRVSVKPGFDSVLQIHLATLLSTVELHYMLPGAAMSDEWKWVLRSSPATRPITRFRSNEATLTSTSDRARVFSETHAALSVSGGDSSFVDTDEGAGSGTVFALSTNIFGKNQLRLGGSVAQQASTMYPGAVVFSAFYSREDGSPGNSPEVRVNVTQLGLVNGISGPGNAQGEVRTMSVSIYQAMDLTPDLRLEYGATGETVDYVEHRSYSSPFMRLTRSFGAAGDVVASFSDGGRPDPLLAHQQIPDDEPELVATPSAVINPVPQLSYRNGQIELQRTFSYETGYRKVTGRRELGVSAFDERVANGRVDVAGDRSILSPSNLMSDGVSATSIYNMGDFSRWGIVASADERLASTIDAGLSYGCLGGFVTGPGTVDESGALSGFLQQRSLNTVNATLNARLPRAGTRISTSYGWVDRPAIVPEHVFTTQNGSIMPGLNVSLRQPLPSFFGMAGRLELRADVRNLLAQGYLPVAAGDGRTLLVVQAPRAVRGGLYFTF